MKTRFIITLILALSTLCSMSAQLTATTETGKKVLLNEDNTWEYQKVEAPVLGEPDCSEFIETTTDKMTGKSRTGSKSTIIISDDGAKTGFGIFLLKSSNGKNIIMTTKVAGLKGCVEQSQIMNILFRDGERMKLINNGKFNCKSVFTTYFGGVFRKKKELELLSTKDIETIRTWSSDGYVEKDLDPQQSRELRESFACLRN